MRWVRTPDGWGSETVHGRHVRLDGDLWVIDVLGEERRLLRSEWSHCQE